MHHPPVVDAEVTGVDERKLHRVEPFVGNHAVKKRLGGLVDAVLAEIAQLV